MKTTRLSEAVEAFFVRNRERLVWVHAAMFAAFLAIIVVPLLLPDPPEDATRFTHYTTFANYLLWGIWFPLVFLSVIFTGRSWCGLFCPMGAASEWVNRIGLQRRILAWMRWEGTPALSFIVVTILGQTLGVRDHPEAAAEVFGGTMAAAMLTGFLYGRKKRAWCRHLCPIGRVLGLYSRLGPVQFAPQVKVPGHNAYAEKGACPTMIDLAQKSESRHCIECFRCVNPGARGSIRMVFRRIGVEIEEIRSHRANTAEAWFLFLDTGVALGGFLWLVLPQYQSMRQTVGTWAIERDWTWPVEVGPAWLVSVHPERAEVFLWLGFVMIAGFMAGFMIALAALLAGLTSAAARLALAAAAARPGRKRRGRLVLVAGDIRSVSQRTASGRRSYASAQQVAAMHGQMDEEVRQKHAAARGVPALQAGRREQQRDRQAAQHAALGIPIDLHAGDAPALRGRLRRGLRQFGHCRRIDARLDALAFKSSCVVAHQQAARLGVGFHRLHPLPLRQDAAQALHPLRVAQGGIAQADASRQGENNVGHLRIVLVEPEYAV